jgi:hypothetical protein
VSANLLSQLRRHPKRWVTGAVTATLAIVLAACEASGWPLLADPAARWLGDRLQRQISFEDGLRLHLLGASGWKRRVSRSTTRSGAGSGRCWSRATPR